MLPNNKLTYIDALYLLEQASLLVPGLKKALSFYYDPFDRKIAGSILEYPHKTFEEVHLESDYDLMQIMDYRTKKQATSWINTKELPFNLQREHSIQATVFEELDNIVLLLRFVNKDDGKMDLLYLFFNSDASNFGLKKSSDILKTENKSIISQLIYNSFKQIIAQRNTLMNQHSRLQEHYSLIRSKYELQKQEEQKIKQDVQKQILNYCQFLLSKHSTKLGVHVEISRQLMENLSNYKGSIQKIDELISKAVQRSYETNSDILSPVLTLEEWHFDDLDTDIFTAISHADELSPDSRYLSTFKILDRYEVSARKLVANREKLTGANVGKALPAPISAAAITDSIKKHQSKIKTLCKQYPHRWKIIRNEFRPLMNVLGA